MWTFDKNVDIGPVCGHLWSSERKVDYSHMRLRTRMSGHPDKYVDNTKDDKYVDNTTDDKRT